MTADLGKVARENRAEALRAAAPIVPTPRRALLTVAILIASVAAVLVMVDIVGGGIPFRSWFYVNVIGPSVERDWGFHLQLRHHETLGDVPTVVSVVPGGAFAAAGVVAGDVPLRLCGSDTLAEGWVYKDLSGVRRAWMAFHTRKTDGSYDSVVRELNLKRP